jgi:predicted nucleotidyltransferase
LYTKVYEGEKMIIHRPFDDVLRSWSHVAVLRTLLDSNVGISGNEVARVSGMHPRSALKALSSLEALGIVHRQRGGRDHLFTLNREHFLVSEGLFALYHAEIAFLRSIEESLSVLLGRKVLSAMLFGSAVRREETPQSDLDILCIAKSENSIDLVRQILASEAPGLQKRFGIKLAPVFLTVEEFKKKARSRFIKGILIEGRVIVGRSPQGLLNG